MHPIANLTTRKPPTPIVDLDPIDRKILETILKDASQSLRDIASQADVTAPTVAARLERLQRLDLVGPARRDIDLTRLGTLILLIAPPEDRDRLIEHENIHQVHRSQGNQAIALALVPDENGLEQLQDAFPNARTHILTQREKATTPQIPHQPAQSPCAQCGKPIHGDEGIELKLGEHRYLACCTSCQTLLENRHDKHQTNAP